MPLPIERCRVQIILDAPVGLDEDFVDAVDVDGFFALSDGFEEGGEGEIAGPS